MTSTTMMPLPAETDDDTDADALLWFPLTWE